MWKYACPVNIRAEQTWTLLVYFFGMYYIFYLFFKWLIGIIMFFLVDSWIWIIKKIQGKGYVWHCKKWFSGVKRTYYCHDCGYNFKA